MLKKFLALSLVVAACYACNNSDQAKTKTAVDSTINSDNATKPAVSDLSKNPDYQKGIVLVAGADCLTCHKIDETNTGPSYRDVANKYSTADDAVINTLADKIIKGGTGNWGSVPMTAHDALSKDDAKAMVKYILLLKNK
jgi:cytochrome c